MTTKKHGVFSPVNLALIGVMTAIGSVLYFWEIPLFAHLKLDLSNVPAYLLGCIAGPLPGILTEVLINLIHMPRSSSMLIGEIMNIGIGCSVILSMHFTMKGFEKLFRKPHGHALVYMCAAAVAVGVAIVIGWLLNLIATPVFFSVMGAPMEENWISVYVFGSTLLNTVKTVVCLFPFYPLYYAMWRAYRRFS